ncbi:hypothetical protein EDD85DRAFT_117853 [Armillaria nabsnona]|nr:hypothetical protein EDD85DRAFT_117853 [Armillaria nabsnona]
MTALLSPAFRARLCWRRTQKWIRSLELANVAMLVNAFMVLHSSPPCLLHYKDFGARYSPVGNEGNWYAISPHSIPMISDLLHRVNTVNRSP